VKYFGAGADAPNDVDPAREFGFPAQQFCGPEGRRQRRFIQKSRN
jgi:hypothetical protein